MFEVGDRVIFHRDKEDVHSPPYGLLTSHSPAFTLRGTISRIGNEHFEVKFDDGKCYYWTKCNGESVYYDSIWAKETELKLINVIDKIKRLCVEEKKPWYKRLWRHNET